MDASAESAATISDTRIPRVFHRIWVGTDPMPAEFARYRRTWLDHHPGWQMRTWTDADVPRLRNQALYDQASAYVPTANVGQFRADMLRYELLAEHGGVYVDADFECLASVEHLLDGMEAFAAWEVQDMWIANGFMGAVPGHRFLDRLIDGLPASVTRLRGYRPNRSSGPQYLTALYRDHPDELTVLPARVCYPYLYSDIGTPKEHPPWPTGTLAVHHWANRRRTLARGARA